LTSLSLPAFRLALIIPQPFQSLNPWLTHQLT
jgi:hypothetical protein